MNYAGKFDGAISSDGPGNHSHFVHLNPGHIHAPADAIVVPDAHFLFNADFKRSGVDLVLSSDDHELVLHEYFKGEKHKALASPDGAHLTGELVDALTGHVELAQAGSGTVAASAVIGHITKMQGSATVIRNGVSIILNMGDNVEKGDVVQSGSNSSVGITFIDGTVFGLSSNAKMVLNEMVYDPNGSNNSSLISLVAGTITFVAGETAKRGDMKIDTPVATMGIRGTAVLVEIDFSVPGANGAPNASFQVLVEPDGTTGSYILFDKATMQPLAIVNQAGQQININNGVISQTQNPLTPEMQNLITDVFKQKFTDNSTTKTTSPTGSSTPDGTTAQYKYADAAQQQTTTQGTGNNQQDKPTAPSGPGGQGTQHVAGAPIASFTSVQLFFIERPGLTGSSALDQMKFTVGFSDPNPGDTPTVRADFTGFTLKDAAGHDVPLSPLAQQDVLAAEIDLNPALVAAAGNANNGSTDVLYSLADKDFDFLAQGQSITLSYVITVNNNYGPAPEVTKQTVTFTIFGTNDVPVIADDKLTQLIEFKGGTSTPGGTLTVLNGEATGGTYDFKDPDLTDTHWIVDANKDPAINHTADPNASDRFNSVHKAALTSASLTLPDGTTLDKAGLEALAPGPMSVFEQALDVNVSTDSTGTGNGEISWQLENLPVFLADFIPAGETLKLYYTIEVTDENGATDTKVVEVDITGTNAAATVWVHTTDDGHDGNWTTGANWGTGKAPTAVDDVIIVTDQLHPHTPAYPATITTGTNAAAHSVVMNDFVVDNTQPVPQTIPPELKLETGSSLTIGTSLVMSADSILTNAGTVNIGTQLELKDDATNPVTPVNESVINNSGTINIGQGGDIQGVASVTNSGTIDLKSGTLNLDVNVANSANASGGDIIVESGAKLVLGGDANTGKRGGVTGGTVTVNGGGELDLTGVNTLSSGTLSNTGQVNVSGLNNILSGETVSNTGTASAIDITGVLTAKNGTAITNTDASSGETVESGGTLTLQNASSISGGQVTNAGMLNVQGTTASLSGGKLTNTHQVNVSGSNNALTAEQVLNTGTASAIDITGTLTAQTGTTIANQDATSGETIESGGTLTLADTSSISNGQVTNAGTLNLQGTTASLSGGKLTNTHQVNVSGSNNALTAEQVLNTGTASAIDITGTLTAQTGTTIANQDATSGETIESGGTLTLADTSSISNGQITNAGTLNLQGTTASLSDGKLTNTHQVNVSGSNNALTGQQVFNTGTASAIDITGTLTAQTGTTIANQDTTSGETIESGASLTLDDTSSISGGKVIDKGTLTLNGTSSLSNGILTNTAQVNAAGTNGLHNESISNSGAGAIDITGDLTLDLGTAITNGTGSGGSNAETIESGASLTLDDTSSISGGKVIDKGTLTLNGTSSLSNGILTNTAQVNAAGTNGLHNESISNSGAGAIDITGDLTLDLGTAITNGTGSGGSNAETIESGASLTLDDTASISGGKVIDKGTLTLNGTSSLSNGILTNTAQVNAAGTNGLHNESVSNSGAGAIDITGDLTLDLGTAITNGTGSGGSNAETIESGASLTLDDTSSISGGKVIDKGTLTLNGTSSLSNGILTNTAQVNAVGTNGLHNESISNSGAGAIDITGDLTLDLGTAITNGTGSGGSNAETIESGASLTLDDTSSISGGKVIDKGTLTLNGTSSLSNGILTNTAQVNAVGTNGLHNESISNSGAGAIDITGDLTLDLGTAITNGTGSGGSNAETIESGASLTLKDTSSISGGKVTNAGTLNLQGTTASLSSGSLANTGTLNVSGSGNVLDDETVTANNMLEVLVGAALTLDQGTSIANSGGTVKVDASATLTLNDANITNGTVTNAGTINSAGGGAINQANITNTGTIESTSGTLTIDPSGPSQTFTLTNSNLVKADGGSLYIVDEQVSNTGTLEAINGGTLKLTGLTVTNTAGTHNGTVSTDGTSELDLSNADITGGTVTNAGTIDSTGGGKIESADITNTGTIESTVGLMTIDGTTSGSGPTFTLTNSNLVKADGGQLYIIDEQVANIGTLEAINGGTLKLTGLTVTNTDPLGVHDGAVSVGNLSTLDLSDAHISGGSLSNAGTVYSTGISTIDAAITNDHSIEVGSGTLTLSGSISGGGSATIDGGATLDLASSFVDSQDVTFAGSGAELIIEGPAANGATSQNFTGDIHGFAATDEIDLRGISYGNPTYASYTYDATTGVLTVNDGNGSHYDLDIGTGYAGAHFAGSDDTHGGTLITMTVDDHLPSFGQVSLTTSLAEQADQTGSGAHDPVSPLTAGGTLSFTDVDLTDLPTVSIAPGGQSVSWTDTDGTTDLSASLSDTQKAALENALTLNAHNGNHNNGATDWNYSIADSALDFLGEGQTLTITTTVVLDDHQNTTPLPTEQITVTITGANDAPQIAFSGGTTISATEDTSAAISGLSVSDPDSNAGPEQLVLHVDHGTLAVSTADGLTGDLDGSDGSLTLTGSLADINNALATLHYAPGSNFSGTDDLHLSIDDQVPNAALTTTKDIAIGVAPVADTPTVATLTAGYSANADSTITLTGFTGVGDTDGSETLSLTLSNFPDGTTFSAGHLDQATGNWVVSATDITGLHGDALSMTPPTDFGGTFSLHVDATVTDTATLPGGPASDIKTFSNDVAVAVDKLTATDDAITDQPTFTENSDTTIATSVLLANDTDSLGNPITITSVGDIDHHSANGGTVTLNGNVITYTPATDFSGQDSFTYTISEGTQTSTATVTFDVAAPAATSGSASVTLGPADFNFDGSTYAVGPVATTNIGNGSDGVTLVGSVNWNGEGDAGHPQVIFYNGNTSVSGSGLFGEVTANGLDLQILAGGNAILDTGVTLDAGQWHNIALTHENGTFILYVDGAVAYTGDAGANGIPNPSYPNEAENMFVAGDGGENFNGAVANVSVWNTALTPAQVQGTDFNALTGHESGLVAYYPLNDGSGTTVADTVNSAGNLQINGSGIWDSATGDTALTIAPDGLQHQVFPFVQISDSTTIDHATVTWNVNGSGASIAGEGLDAFANPLGISITVDPSTGGYLLSGTASLAAYEDVLSHLTFATSDPASDGTAFTVTITDSNGDSASATSTIDVAIPSGWDVWNGQAGTSNWNTGGNWSLGHAPGPSDTVLIEDATVNDDLGQNDADQSITQLHLVSSGMASGPMLDITNFAADSRTFTITGALNADGNRVALSNTGSITIENQNLSEDGNQVSTEISADIQGSVQNSGNITIYSSDADEGGVVSALFEGQVQNNGTITVEAGGNATASATFSDDVQNSNTISVLDDSGGSTATAEFSAGFIQNIGTISADGYGATLVFDAVTVDQLNGDSSGTIAATDNAVIVFDGTTVSGGEITGDSSQDLQIQVGDSAFNGVVALTLEDGVTVVDQTMTIGSGVTLEVERGSNGPGATLDDVNVTNYGVVQVDQSQLPTTTLTLEDGTIITGGTLSIGSSGIVDVEVGPEDRGGNNEYSFDAQLDHVTVTNGGIIEVDLNDEGAVLNLADGTSITGGTLDVGTGEVYVQSGFNGGVTLDHVTVTMDNSGEIEIGTAQSQGSTLVLEDGTTITGGTLSLDDTGDTVEILFGTNDIGATFDNVQVENSGTIQVGSAPIFGDPTLLLKDGTTISDGTLDIESTGVVNVQNGANGGATLNDVTVTNTGAITIGSGATLTLENDTCVNGAITFTGTGDTLALDSTTNVKNAVLSGFVSGNVIDFTDVTADEDASVGYSNGVLTLTYYAPGDAEHQHAFHERIKLSGGYSQSNFALQDDGHGGTEIVETGLVINQGVQTAAVADGGNWYATGQLTVSNPGSGDTWSVVNGSNYATASYNFGIDEFSVVKTNGNTPTTVFDDSFDGTVPPTGPAIQNGSSPSGVSYNDFSSGTYVQGSGEALIESNHDGYVGTALGVGVNYGKPVFGQFTTLLTATSYNTNDPTDGLRSGQSFNVSGTFDLTTPSDTTSRYGIRLSDRVSSAANPANDQPGTEVVDLGIVRSANGQAVVVLTEYNYETGVSDTLQSVLVNASAQDNEISLSLSNDAANNGVIVASYTLEKSDGAGGEVADGTFTFGAVGHIFDNENWTRAQFYGLDTSTTTSSSPQADSIKQGTYGQLDLAQDGTWHYQLNPGLASVKALADGEHAQDNFQVQVTNAAGQQSTQTITVDVAGTNDAPVATAPAQYSVTSGTPISLVNTGLSVSDADDGGQPETVTLSASEGTISLTVGNSGISADSITGNGTGSVTFSGTIAQINALLNHSNGANGGTIVYADNAASPGFFSSATLKLTIDDEGSNGGTALSDTASATINIAPAEGTLNWDREIDPFTTATTANSSQWVIPNADGLTSTVFNAANGSSFTYDPTTGLPTNGVVGSIQLVDNTTGINTGNHVMQSITNLNGLQIGDFGNFIAREQAIEAKIPWAGLIESGETGPASFTDTDIRIANSDGTFTEILGNSFSQSADDTLTGTVTAVELFDSNNNLLQTVSFTGGTSLSDLASAVFPDNSSHQFYGLMVPANATVTGFNSSVASGAVNYFEINDTPGNHTYGSPSLGIIGVNFSDATSGVTANLAQGTASWGGFTDTLNNISFVFGSKFADTIVGNAFGGVLDGGGAQAGTHDTMTGSAGTTFMFQHGYGALTITNFDQAGGSFDSSEHDQLNFNGFSGNPNVHSDGNGNTIVDFGSGDVVTLLGVADASQIPQSDIHINGSNGGNNNGPVISHANNSETYTGTPVTLDSTIQLTDAAATVMSVNTWISSGEQSGDQLTINGTTDGTITELDGSIISYHFDATLNTGNNEGHGLFLFATSGAPTTADFQAALQMIQFSPSAANGDRTVTYAAQDANDQFSSTETTTVHVNPILNISGGGDQTISGPSDDTVVFATGSGTLHLDQPSTFTGAVAGISGTGDVLDMHGFTAATTTATTGTGSFDSTTDTTTLTVHDSNGNLTETFKLVGDLSNSLWTVTTDNHGGVNIVDPPASSGQLLNGMIVNDPGPAASGQLLNGMIMNDPGPAASPTVTATAPNQTLAGSAASDNFVFNFKAVGSAILSDFHLGADSLQFAQSIFANAQAVFDALHDDGHGNTIIGIDAHDTVTLGAVLKAQLHVGDFHVV